MMKNGVEHNISAATYISFAVYLWHFVITDVPTGFFFFFSLHDKVVALTLPYHYSFSLHLWTHTPHTVTQWLKAIYGVRGTTYVTLLYILPSSETNHQNFVWIRKQCVSLNGNRYSFEKSFWILLHFRALWFKNQFSHAKFFFFNRLFVSNTKWRLWRMSFFIFYSINQCKVIHILNFMQLPSKRFTPFFIVVVAFAKQIKVISIDLPIYSIAEIAFFFFRCTQTDANLPIRHSDILFRLCVFVWFLSLNFHKGHLVNSL